MLRPPTFNKACARGCQKWVAPKKGYFFVTGLSSVLFIIKSTGDVFHSGTNIDDLE